MTNLGLKLKGECGEQRLPKPEIVEERVGFIKLRINLTHNAYIDLYFNEDTETMTSALVVREKRVFGINGYPRRGQWHLHPAENVQKNITRKTRGVMAVHIGGLICPDIRAIKEACGDRGLFLAEDAAKDNTAHVAETNAGNVMHAWKLKMENVNSS